MSNIQVCMRAMMTGMGGDEAQEARIETGESYSTIRLSVILDTIQPNTSSS